MLDVRSNPAIINENKITQTNLINLTALGDDDENKYKNNNNNNSPWIRDVYIRVNRIYINYYRIYYCKKIIGFSETRDRTSRKSKRRAQ